MGQLHETVPCNHAYQAYTGEGATGTLTLPQTGDIPSISSIKGASITLIALTVVEIWSNQKTISGGPGTYDT